LEHRQENGRIYLDGTYADKFWGWEVNEASLSTFPKTRFGINDVNPSGSADIA
jgi:hypothetical protein